MADLELEDGQLLDPALIRVTPPGHPLEVSLLGWIFNPVFLKVGADQRIRAWTDFAAGGMVVFEDRFIAHSYFEFRASELARAVDLLYALRVAGGAGTSVTTMTELMAVIDAVEKSRPPDAWGLARGPLKGLSDLIRCWNCELQVDRVRSSCGRLWPESFLELAGWIKECSLRNEELPPGTEGSFFREISELALRRFPAISRRAALEDQRCP